MYDKCMIYDLTFFILHWSQTTCPSLHCQASSGAAILFLQHGQESNSSSCWISGDPSLFSLHALHISDTIWKKFVKKQKNLPIFLILEKFSSLFVYFLCSSAVSGRFPSLSLLGSVKFTTISLLCRKFVKVTKSLGESE
jgi:hypothetical protein